MDITQICICRVQDALKAKGYARVKVVVVVYANHASVMVEGNSINNSYHSGPTVADAFDKAEALVEKLEPLPTAETIARTLGIVEVEPGLWREAA